MLFPLEGIPVVEYDVTLTVTPTSRHGHDSDTVLANTEMLVRNDSAEDISFPFMVMTTDPGDGATDRGSVEPRVLNGSQPVQIEADELDQDKAAELARQRAAAAGADAGLQETVERWARDALAKAERIRVGRTKIGARSERRIVLQQRLRVQGDEAGTYKLVTIAPSPLLTLGTGGRVSVYALLPFEDADVRVTVLEESGLTELNFGYELQKIKARQIVSWFWQNDPVFKLAYRYG